MDARYEVRDAQQLAGMLADEGLASPTRIGAIGDSYGGGESLILGTLRDRMMDFDGQLQPWTSPLGKPMAIAAATPTTPWSDLASSLVPNGDGLDYTLPQPTDNYTPTGVLKQSFATALFALGLPPLGYYAPLMADSSADLTSWLVTLGAGEPYDGNPAIPPIIDQLRLYRSALHLLDGTAGGGGTEAPAPMLLSSGFTDDLFPVDETLRYYNLERSRFPNAPVSLSYLDYGHSRGQNKPADTTFLRTQINMWLDHYVLGGAPDPGQSVTALTQTCPSGAASGGPYTAASWAALHPGTLQYTTTRAQTLNSAAGDPAVSAAIDPIAGQGACGSVSAADQAGTATYRLRAAIGSGFTMIGAPTIVAQMAAAGPFPELAARLWDVAPDGTQALVARGDFRPPNDTSQLQYFQLHPGAWRFAAGHVPKLELLGRDAPYVRTSNGQFTIAISALRLNLPAVETSGNGISVLPALPAPAGSQPASGATITTLTSLFPASTAPTTTTTTTTAAARPVKHRARCATTRKHSRKAKQKRTRKGKKGRQNRGKRGKKAGSTKPKQDAQKQAVARKCRKAARHHDTTKQKGKKH